MSTFADRVFHTIYATNFPQRKRTEPMQVIAVGISRSGTDSLRQALHSLGVDHTWHGYDSILPPYSLEEWYKLAIRKYKAALTEKTLVDGIKVSREDFDHVIGHCVGISDLPAAVFARELIAAYPEAKVILNTRSDMPGWHKSFASTIGGYDNRGFDWDWCKSWFCAELFWARRYLTGIQFPGFFHGSFTTNGVWVYQEHVAMIRGLGLPRERLLEWSAPDGWEPLCEFLGKEVPNEPFPSGNPTTEWFQRVGVTMNAHNRRAVRNVAIFGTLVTGLMAWGVYAIRT